MKPACLTRRHFFANSTLGLGGVALSWLLHRDGALGAPMRPELEPRRYDLTPKETHHAPRARAMISMFMQGGPSHHDLLDPKPVMQRLDGTTFPGTIKYDSTDQASS